jgi:hypothetical protein
MSVRPPQSLTPGRAVETGLNVLDYEIAQQKAQTLGDMGQQVEQALSRLRAFEAEGRQASDPGEHERLRDRAAEKVWALMIQRELCGLRHWDQVVKAYAIPREVLNRMGRVTAPAAGKP